MGEYGWRRGELRSEDLLILLDDWRFVPPEGGAFFDSGSAFCH
jgi:hypothetical protein